jgi:hypothetical protein
VDAAARPEPDGVRRGHGQMKQKPVVASLLIWTAAMLTTACLAQNPTDAEIQSAIDRGKVTPSKKLWESIKKKQEFRINRAGLDPIEKKVLILADADRIALEASEAKRQLREISVEQIKQHLPLGLTEVLLEELLQQHVCWQLTEVGSERRRTRCSKDRW